MSSFEIVDVLEFGGTKDVKVEFLCGTSIVDAIREMFEYLNDKSNGVSRIVTKFNGVNVGVITCSRPHEVLEKWWKDMDRKTKEYHNSEDYLVLKAKRKAENIKNIDMMKRQMHALTQLDLSDPEVVLDWILSCEPYRGDSKVEKKFHMQISQHLELAGYKYNENCGKDYINGDEVNNAR